MIIVGLMAVEVFLALRIVALDMRDRDPDSVAVVRDPSKARRRNNPLPPGLAPNMPEWEEQWYSHPLLACSVATAHFTVDDADALLSTEGERAPRSRGDIPPALSVQGDPTLLKSTGVLLPLRHIRGQPWREGIVPPSRGPDRKLRY